MPIEEVNTQQERFVIRNSTDVTKVIYAMTVKPMSAVKIMHYLLLIITIIIIINGEKANLEDIIT